jgi:predicted PurR-regulated permease PerM
LLWGLVEVSVPDSFWRIIFRHNIKLIYFFGGLLVLAGILEPILFRIGLAALLATLVVDVGSWLLKSMFAQRHGVVRAIIIAAAVLVAGLASIGGYQVFAWIEQELPQIREWFQNLGG